MEEEHEQILKEEKEPLDQRFVLFIGEFLLLKVKTMHSCKINHLVFLKTTLYNYEIMSSYYSDATSNLLALRKQRLNLSYDLEEEIKCLSLDGLIEEEKNVNETSHSNSRLPCNEIVYSKAEFIRMAGTVYLLSGKK
jgi:hypothetical protein